MINTQAIFKDYQRLKEAYDKLLQKNNALEARESDLSKALEKSQDKNTQLTSKLENLLEQIKLMNQRKFASSSEANILQQNFFDEVGVADSSGEDNEPQKKTVTYTRNAKNQPKRKAFPESLERVEIIIDIDEADKTCACCGKERCQMGEEVTERLILIPAKLKVEKTIRPKYVCNSKQCSNEDIFILPLPPRILPKSNASPSIIADILTKKYVDHLPLYRQQQAWKRLGIHMPRNTMCGWIMTLAEECSVLYRLLRKHILRYDVICVDETTVQVLNEPERGNHKKSYIWAYRGGPPNKTVVYFEYQESRESEHPMRFLETYSGFVMSDAYSGYHWIDREENFRVIHVYCMSHARRPFAELVKLTKTPGYAHTAVGYFAELYTIEKQARDNNLTPEARFILRLKKSKPILDKLFNFLKDTLPKAPPGSKLAKGIKYMLDREEGFYAYLSDGRLEIDNNLLENEIRPFALGRKNWMFLGSPRGAEAACIFYSLIQTAKANGLDPCYYLTTMLERLPHCKTEAEFEKLLPWHIKAELDEAQKQDEPDFEQFLQQVS